MDGPNSSGLWLEPREPLVSRETNQTAGISGRGETIMNVPSLRDLPPLGGVCSFEEAMRPGLRIEDCVARLKRFHYAFKRLHEIFTARITSEPIYELKTAFSLHAYLCSEHMMSLRARVGEMREPPLGLDAVPSDPLQVFFDEILAAPDTAGLIFGLYGKALPALDAALVRHMEDTNPLADAPSVRLLRFARLELAEMLRFGAKAVEQLVDASARAAMADWLGFLDDCLAAAGGLDGAAVAAEKAIARRCSATPYVYDPKPRRDERFTDLWNQGVNAETFLHDPEMPAKAKTLMLYFRRIREIDVPEMMAGIIAQTPGKPAGYYRDMSRQVWDEARHALMGEVGFVSQGVDWRLARITWNWSYRLNTECTPIERHAVLYFIEQGLMGRTGKRYEMEVGDASGDPLAALFQDYDWADEVLHARIGRDWYVSAIGDASKAIAYGDECWSKITGNWRSVLDEGLTQHENWWPGLYAAACRSWGVAPDSKVMAYHQSYEGKRADLKAVSFSG
jgi:hypothetical protein